ncbi:hypothetical protein ID866_4578 [Astraeus odoratus]|nr:hypothetical protein ID866_4578 [Astraeus odoratus]
MSRRAAAIEEFNDDTDLPLPSRPLLSASAHGPILEEITASDEEDSSVEDDEGATAPGPASSFRPAPPVTDPLLSNTITDITPYKHKDIADATNRLGLGTIHEVNKVHPRDWENPGRVRVQWKKDGRPINSAIKTKRQLLEMISLQIQRIKPDNIPRPPYAMLSSSTTPAVQPIKTISNKGKQPAKSKVGNTAPLQPQKTSMQRLPVPPEPHPPLANRLSPYSPILPTGVLIETVKAGMNAQDQGAGPGMTGGGMQKGKRKVIRVRG